MAGKDRADDRALDRGRGGLISVPEVFGYAGRAVTSTRPLQWTKSLLLFLPLAFAVHEKWLTDETGLPGELFLRALASAIIFCALSGAVYIINDIFDRQRDREHPRKWRRPIASGEFPLPAAQTTAVVLLGLSLAASFVMDTGFGIVGLVFVGLNLGYSSLLKGMIILDVMVVSAGYLLRVVAGALIIDVTVSPWLYTTIGLGALFIAVGKRYSELKIAGSNAQNQRSVLGQYSQELLGQMITVTSTAALVGYALYTFTASNVPDNHSMMLTVPFVIFGLFRYLYLVNQTNEAESPEILIIKDRPLVAAILLWAATAITILAVSR